VVGADDAHDVLGKPLADAHLDGILDWGRGRVSRVLDAEVGLNGLE